MFLHLVATTVDTESLFGVTQPPVHSSSTSQFHLCTFTCLSWQMTHSLISFFGNVGIGSVPSGRVSGTNSGLAMGSMIGKKKGAANSHDPQLAHLIARSP